MIEINLIPDVKRELLRAQRTRSAVVSVSIITGIIALSVVALLLIYVYLIQGGRHLYLDGQIDDKNKELSSIEDVSKILTLQNQLKQISALNEGKKLDSRVFDMLQSVVPPEQIRVSLVTLDAETTTITVEGRANTYDSVEVFKKTLEGAQVTYRVDGEEQADQLATEMNLSNVSYGQDESNNRVVNFSLQFAYPQSLFAASNKSIVIKLTNQGNVTDSYLGVPRSVFLNEEGEN
jgi:Tfp pilus assembly protein PilN